METSAIDTTTVLSALEGTAALSTGDSAAAYAVDGTSPTAAAHPSDLGQLGHVLSVASQKRLAVAPYGGGTRTALGQTISRLDCVVKLTRLDGVIAHNPADLTATVQTGVTLSSLQKLLGEHGQFLALDPPLPDRATVGGTLATAVSGPLKWQYGSPRDVVIGMTVVQADGKVTKSGGQVVKNVSGYDMARLHVGGLGTLGVIGDVSFKLTPLPTKQATVIASYDTVSKGITAGLQVFWSDVVPLALTAFNGAANKRISATEIDGQGLLAIRLGGRPRTLERMADECRTICQSEGPSSLEVLSEADHAALWRKLADFGWDEQTTPAIGCRASVLPSRVAELAQAIADTGSAEGLRPALVGHPAHGTMLIGWYSTGGDVSPEAAHGAFESTRALVHGLGGRLVVERCPAEAKARFDVWDERGEPVEIMRRLKGQFDPKNVLNPGRFVGGI